METDNPLETLVVMGFSRDISEDIIHQIVDVINAPEEEGGVELRACRIKDRAYKVNHKLYNNSYYRTQALPKIHTCIHTCNFHKPICCYQGNCGRGQNSHDPYHSFCQTNFFFSRTYF